MNVTSLIAGGIGFVLGAIIGAALVAWRAERDRRRAEGAAAETTDARRAETSLLVDQVRTSFAALSREALSANSDDFLKLAKTRLDQQTASADQTIDAKKRLIDARLEEVDRKLLAVSEQMQNVEKQRAEAFATLFTQLQSHGQVTAQLREALANPQRRGRWGERMAEDVLQLAGLMEGVNYTKQQQLSDGGKPDFTFNLPGGKTVHMDVKFPLVNYLEMLDAADADTRAERTKQFLRDVRRRIKEVTTRAYIDPAAGTVEYILVFIPNEQVHGFIHENDPGLLDEAMRAKVVLCSPLTLYAFLAVIRQAAESFRFEQSSRRILDLLAEFRKQWTKYVELMDKMGDKLHDASKQYDELVGVRTRQLEKSLMKIDDVQEEQTTSPIPLIEDAHQPTPLRHGD